MNSMHYYLALKTAIDARTTRISVREFGTPWERDVAVEALETLVYPSGSLYKLDHDKSLPDMIDWMKDKASRSEHPPIIEAG